MKLSVIIVNYNHKYFPRMAVEALEKSITDFDYEIIVVDNNSTDAESLGFLEKAAGEMRITLIKSPKNIGFGRGNNLGSKVAGGDHIFLHNPDVTVKEDSLQMIADFMDHHPEVGVMGPKLVYSNGKVQESCRRDMRFTDLVLNRTFLGGLPFFKSRVQKYLMEDFDHGTVREVDLLTGAAMIIPRDVFEKVGGFDHRYSLFMEDFDLCKEIKKAGRKIVYNPEIELRHYHKRLSQGSTARLIFKKVFWKHIISAIKYFWKWRKS